MACRRRPIILRRPAESGDGAYRAMAAAIKRAGLSPGDIDYINAHGTSTPLGDEIEIRAVERLVGNSGHQLSHVVDEIGDRPSSRRRRRRRGDLSILAIRDQIVPPTLNLDHPSAATEIDLVPHTPRKREVEFAMSNSFGFGGTNACVIFKHPD